MAMPPPRWHCHELWLQAAYVRGPPVRGLQLRTGRPAFPHDAWAWHEGSDPDICVPGGGAGGQIRREILCAGFGWATSELTGPMCCCVASTPLFSYQSAMTHYERWCLIRRPPPIQSKVIFPPLMMRPHVDQITGSRARSDSLTRLHLHGGDCWRRRVFARCPIRIRHGWEAGRSPPTPRATTVGAHACRCKALPSLLRVARVTISHGTYVYANHLS